MMSSSMGDTHIQSSDTEAGVAKGMGEADQGSAASFSRREVLKGAAGAAIAAPLVLDEVVAQKRRPGSRATSASKTNTGGKRPLFFSPAEFALLDELTELIIPTDEHSPGARAAGVAAYLDKRIAETNPAIAEYAKERQIWRSGLRLVDAVSQEMHSKTFMQANATQRIKVLERFAEQEPRPAPLRSQINPPRPGEQPQTQPPGQPGEIYKEGAQNRPEQKAPDAARKSEGEFFTFLKAQAARAYYTSEIGIHKELEYKGNLYLKDFVGYDVATGKYTDAPKNNSTS